ncbi:hypothetical protein GP486_004814 [Trichoglossum hirsutum]|uniref:Sld7 C-terminal domain-containing protein n=1 Tax=Trichoglossum hirsutum TaxID=265104 RepID=A0A9P8RND3_9PEZI|nr:hypothetical protein GP486_004814 [Trichoglossum hirsutum]
MDVKGFDTVEVLLELLSRSFGVFSEAPHRPVPSSGSFNFFYPNIPGKISPRAFSNNALYLHSRDRAVSTLPSQESHRPTMRDNHHSAVLPEKLAAKYPEGLPCGHGRVIGYQVSGMHRILVSDSSKLENGASLPENAELAFLSFVAPSRIPLYLVAGPSLDVWTDNEATESWFRDFLLYIPDEPGRDGEGDRYTAWWDTHRCQSDVGALLRVNDRSDSVDSSPRAPGPKITEVLLYGTLLEVVQNAGQLPTPPASSSPVPLATEDEDAASGAHTASVTKQLTVHVLLLSSELCYSEAQAATSGRSAATVGATLSAREGSEVVDAQFLPPLFQYKKHGVQPPLKRRRAETLLEDATDRVRKARRSGGKRVSQAMAGVTGTGSGAFLPPATTTQAVTSKAETQNLGPEFPADAEGNPANSKRPSWKGSIGTKPQSSGTQAGRSARSGSPSSIPNVARSKEGNETGQIRTASSRKNVLNNNNNNNNNTKEPPLTLSSNAATGDGDCQILREEALEPQNPTRAEKTVDMRNKELLSRIVMAGMRMYGLQQQRKASKSRDVPEGSASIGSHTTLETDEYKLVYHQTFKGACFALVSTCYLYTSLPFFVKKKKTRKRKRKSTLGGEGAMCR